MAKSLVQSVRKNRKKSALIAGIFLTIFAGIGLSIMNPSAKAATAILVPIADVTSEFVTVTGTNDGSCGGAQHCNYVDEGAIPNTADYISNDTSAAVTTEEFALSTTTIGASASQLIITVHAQSATPANGGTLDTLDIALRLNGVLQAATVCTPAFAVFGDCVATYTGPWTQADVDSMQVNIVRNTLGGGNAAARRDIIDIANVAAELTFTAPNNVPAAPTLIAPADAATGVNTTPLFQLRSTDTESDFLQYRILLYQADCTTLVDTIDQTLNQTGWTGEDANGGLAYIGSNTLAGSTIANYTYQGTLAAATTFCWQAAAVDPAGSNTFSANSATNSFTTVAPNAVPAAPTLIAPADAATGVSASPTFQLRTTDPDNDFLQYRILLYESNCTTLVAAIDQTLSQTGWTGQDANGGLAYIGSSTLSGSTIATHTYQAVLADATTYCWQAAAVDPAGSNTFSANSATNSFTTAAALPPPPLGTSAVQLEGGTDLQGGTRLGD